MSRRDLPQTPPALKEVKELEKQAEQNISSAEARLSIVTNAITAAETQKVQAEAELASAEVSRSAKLAEVAVVTGQISEAKDELRQVEGEVLAIRSEKNTELEASTKAKQDHEILLADLTKSHKEQMDVEEKTLKDSRAVVEGLTKVIEEKKLDLDGIERVLNAYKREEQRIEAEVLPKVSAAKLELEALARELLFKQGEILDATTKHAEMVGKYNDEKTRYEEVSALRVGEEQRIETELKKLFDKEVEVENKARSLRVIQQGVDQATSRLERKEEELTVREHLFKKEVTLT